MTEEQINALIDFIRAAAYEQAEIQAGVDFLSSSREEEKILRQVLSEKNLSPPPDMPAAVPLRDFAGVAWRYPATLLELDLAGGAGLKPCDFVDYSYSPGHPGRYTQEGWKKYLMLTDPMLLLAADVKP